MDNRPIRISDIAQELGLSTATVSNVIHGKTKKISDETVQRVTRLLEERQYIPAMAGLLLAQNASQIIGVFLNDHEKYEGHALEDFFIASSLDRLSTEIEQSGRFMMVKKAKSPEEIIRFASMWNMEGIVMIGFCERDYMYLRNHMRIPFAVYDGICDVPERIVNITIDNFDGGYQVGRHFAELGHQRAICISDNDTGNDRQRMRGFCRGFCEGETELLLVPMQRAARRTFYGERIDDIKRATAVFAVSDYYAIDLMRFLNEQGISVPNEISVAGFDDIPACRMVYPALTTVQQDGALRARLAIEKLLELKEGKPVEPEIKLPVSLIVRDSTRKAPTR